MGKKKPGSSLGKYRKLRIHHLGGESKTNILFWYLVASVRRIIMITLLAMLVLVTVNAFYSQETGEIKIRILLREYPGQYYNCDRYSILISDLKKVGVIVTKYNPQDKTYDELITMFANCDVIVIPNPPDDGDFSSDEIKALSEFLSQGKGIFVLGDVQYGGNTFGKPDYLNNLLSGIGVSGIRFWGTNAKGDEIYDNEKMESRPWQVIVTSDYFEPHPISVGIKKVVITSSTLEVSDPRLIIATSPETSYAADVNDEIHARGKLVWLAAAEIGQGRVVVCGSSRMFSDRYLSGIGIPYIQYADNELLFINIIKWLSRKEISPPPKVQIFIPAMDIIGIIGGIILGYGAQGRPRKTFYKLYLILTLLYALAASVQAAILNTVVVGLSWPGWGQVSGSLTTEYFVIPAWGVAFLRYFLAGLILLIIGYGIFYVAQKIRKKRKK